MNYEKPEITPIDTANAAIMGQLPGSKIGYTSDGRGMNKFDTVAAYEADE
jgi:hypothetical protein